jgi:hypothetical protein
MVLSQPAFVSTTHTIDCHDITEILLKVALSICIDNDNNNNNQSIFRDN